ncbi:MAG: SpoIIE family protein phosphatase [Roseiflexaceae bacterium]|nr:SpoIIE family protein phosphatase [Roseiflexaceae bacterium]
MRREFWLSVYCVLVGALGLLLLLLFPLTIDLPTLLLFTTLALLVEGVGFRVPPADPHSLVGVVLLTAALALGPANGALVAACSGLIFGVIAPLIYGRKLSPYLLLARPMLRAGVRALGLLAGAGLAYVLGGPDASQGLLFLALLLCFPLTIQLNRVTREFLQGGRTGVITWWRSSWRAALGAELLPLPVAWLGAAIYSQLGLVYFLLAAVALFAASLSVRRAANKVQRQRRSVEELALLNQVSRAIIRADMDVTALCELIYREASKLVDTSSFHLGLFTPESDQYRLVVRVQDRVRLPTIEMDLPMGDGLVGWMRETGQSLLVEDFTREMERLPARPRYQSDRPPRAGIYVPLSVGEQVIGTISIQSFRANAFDVDDLRMLSLIADQAAVAIAKARAFDQASRRARQLQAIRIVSEQITAILDIDLLLPSVVGLIRERFGYHPVHIFTAEPDSRLSFRATTADTAAAGQERLRNLFPGDGIVGTAFQSGQPLLVNDVAADPRYISDDPNTCAELAVPLRFGNQQIGVLDVQSDRTDAFSDDDLFIMQTLAGQIAVAIESARAFGAQREEAWTLNALLQVAENLARASTLDDLLPAIVRLPPLLLGCERCYCWEWDVEQRRFVPLAAYGLNTERRAIFMARPLDDTGAPLLAEARNASAPLFARDFQHTPGRLPVVAGFGGGALVALPLTARNLPLGVIVADYDAPGVELRPRTRALYAGIANQIAAALETALLAQDAAQAAHLEEELRVARDIQTALLPAHAPRIPGWDIAADWRSARLVGGDFYDFWKLPGISDQGPGIRDQGSGARDMESDDAAHSAPDPRPQTPDSRSLGFIIADVSDKGVAAAMFMGLSRSLVRAAALDGSSPSSALTRANRWIARDSDSAMFVTIFYAILDTESGMLRYTVAGHNPPLLIRANGSLEELKTPGIALGVLDEITLNESETALHPGDTLVCYTDGVTEAINRVEEEFGVARLVAAVSAHRTESAGAMLRAIDVALHNFTEGHPPFDDITLVIVKREG